MARLLLLPLIIMIVGCGQGQEPESTPLIASVLTPEITVTPTSVPTTEAVATFASVSTPEPTPTPRRQPPVLRIAPTVTPVPPGDPTPTPTATPTLIPIYQMMSATPTARPAITTHPTSTPTPVAFIAALEAVLTPVTPEPLSDAEEIAMGTHVINSTVQAMSEESHYSASVMKETPQGSELWVVAYEGVNSPDTGNWRATGFLTTTGSDPVGAKFDSTIDSTCLRITKPEEGPWMYMEHEAWLPVSVFGQPQFTPALPLSTLRLTDDHVWRVVETTGVSVTLKTDQFPSNPGLAFFLVVNRLSAQVDEEVIEYGDVRIRTAYAYFDESQMEVVHEDRSDCEARNG